MICTEEERADGSVLVLVVVEALINHINHLLYALVGLDKDRINRKQGLYFQAVILLLDNRARRGGGEATNERALCWVTRLG
jgi:hypothetical protein